MATLQLEEPPPGQQRGLILDIERVGFTGLDVRILGFPRNRAEGTWVTGRLSGRLVGGHVQIDDDRLAGDVAQEGFSGAPVWRSQPDVDVVVGMLVQANPARRMAIMVPAMELGKRLAFGEPRRGTDNWKLKFFRERGMVSLLNDLESLEVRGLRAEERAAVREALGKISTEMSDFESLAHWETPLHKDLERLRDTYVDWNGHSEGEVGAAARRKALGQLRDERRGISMKMRECQALLYQEELDGYIDGAMEHLASLVRAHPDLFPSVRGMVRKYRKIST